MIVPADGDESDAGAGNPTSFKKGKGHSAIGGYDSFFALGELNRRGPGPALRSWQLGIQPGKRTLQGLGVPATGRVDRLLKPCEEWDRPVRKLLCPVQLFEILELELSFSVEASGDLGLLVPSLRVENFHRELYDCMGLARTATIVGVMMQRLSAAITAELTAIESIERRSDDNRRLRYAVAVGFISAVAIPASLILTFLGINASQVDPHLSMFSRHYLPMYLAVAVLLVIGVLISIALWAQHRRDLRHQRAAIPRPRWTPAPTMSEE